ncbi:MAG TPA: hypothetical protein VFY46_05105 [Acidimicrobiia bacterium]|nr:hypothetical protein [Acidimicrobiia bacterium]
MIVGVRTEVDSVLSVVAPLGLAAAAAEPALMIDLDPEGPHYPGPRSLAEMVDTGPSRTEMSPSSGRLAVLRNGGVDPLEAVTVVQALAATWPRVVVRVQGAVPLMWPVIPVVPLLPGILAPARGRAAVWQATTLSDEPPGPGPVLPALTRSNLDRLLRMRTHPGGRWVAAWRPVWELPWG